MSELIGNLINPESGSGLCGVCDNAVEAHEPHVIISAHGNKYLCHYSCVPDDLDGEDGE